jgi:hypothetical protein
MSSPYVRSVPADAHRRIGELPPQAAAQANRALMTGPLMESKPGLRVATTFNAASIMRA